MGTSNIDDTWMSQFRHPTGIQGRAVAALMNKEHDHLSTWGLSHVKIEPDFVVLDVGCGGGKTIGKLASHAVQGRVFGIDYSRDMVEYSKKENQKLEAEDRINLVQGSVEKMSFPNDFFDLVTAIETYYFWPNLSRAFQEIKRVLKPGAKLLIVSEMIKDGKYEVENAEMVAKAHVKLFSVQEIVNMLECEGLVDVAVFRKSCSPWNAILAKKLCTIMNVI
jgi:ubiquinone/menaquinone biosynthesis C-methylase UbiE